MNAAQIFAVVACLLSIEFFGYLGWTAWHSRK